MSDSRATKAQNLARIRDNQRRSRARRKEYLQELEAKLRSCEQMGIEASAQIQSAARRVLDENKKLRALLHERGVPESEITAVMGVSVDRSFDQSSAASNLTSMLERRISCNPAACPVSPPVSHDAVAAPIAIPVQRTTVLGSNDSPSPHSIVSSMGSTPPAYGNTSFYPTMTPAPEIKTEDLHHQYNNNHNNNNHNNNNYAFEQPLNASWTMPHHANYVPEPTYYNTSSCVDAANIIRTMRADAGPELEVDLGCRAPSQNCYVNNAVVFNLMDKYSNSNPRYGI